MYNKSETTPEKYEKEGVQKPVNPREETPSKANIVYIFDDNYAAITGVSITSLFENNKDLDEISVYLMMKNVSEENIQKFRQLGEIYSRKIVFIDVSDSDKKFEEMGLFSYNANYITYMKMFCVDYVSKDVEQLIYLDSDVIVLRSIKPILKTKGLLGMGKGGLIARAENVSNYVARYGCAILVFDAERWRNENWSGKLMEHARLKGKEYLVPDENMLSIVVGDEIVTLPREACLGALNFAFSKENYMDFNQGEGYTPEEVERGYANAISVHTDRFLGEKPWLKGNHHPNRELFAYWLDRSLWKGYSGGNLPGGFVFRIERWMYRHLPQRWFYRIWNMAQTIYVRRTMRQLSRR